MFFTNYFLYVYIYQSLLVTNNQCWEGYFGNVIGYRLQVTSYFNYFIKVMQLITFDYFSKFLMNVFQHLDQAGLTYNPHYCQTFKILHHLN